MPNQNIEIGNDLIGVGNVEDGGVVTQTINLPTDKIPPQLSSKLGKSTIIGRKKELKEIDSLLKTNNSLLLINGIGGVGKSTIASYYLHSKKDEFNYYGFFEGLESFTIELKPRLNLKSDKPNELFLEALAKLSTLEGNKLLVIDDVKNIEENQQDIDKILELKHSGYKILITSREEIEGDIYQYYLDVLSKEDAKALFNSIYKVEDERLLEEILEYLDYHAFFIEKTAHSIKRTLTPEMIRDKFKSGEFSKISVKRKQNFNKFLNQLFTLDNLDSEEILMLKQLSALPSIEIDFEFLETIFKVDKKKEVKSTWNFFKFFQKKEKQKYNHPNLEELLDFLSENGWLSKLEGGYKLHQIIKEYILSNHIPTFEEVEIILDTFNIMIENSNNAQVAVDNQDNIIYFESFVKVFDKIKIENKKISNFYKNFSNIYHYLGEYNNELKLSKISLKINQKLFNTEHPSIATSYNNLARYYLVVGIYQKALKFYKKALDIREKILGTEHLDTAKTYNGIAISYERMEKYNDAEKLYKKVLFIQKKLLDSKHLDIALSYMNLAGIYSLQKKNEKAKSFYNMSLNILNSLKKHPYTAMLYNNMAIFYKSLNEFDISEEYYKKAIEIYKQVWKENHPNIARSYNGLSKLYLLQNRNNQAQLYKLKAIKIMEMFLPIEHPELINLKNELEFIEMRIINLPMIIENEGSKKGIFYQKVGDRLLFNIKMIKDFFEDFKYFKEIELDIRRETMLWKYHLDIVLYEIIILLIKRQYNFGYRGLDEQWIEYGDSYILFQREKEIHFLYSKFLKTIEMKLGNESLDIAISYNNLAVFFYVRRRYPKAYWFMKRAVNVFSKVLPSNHPNLINAKEGLEIIQEKLNR